MRDKRARCGAPARAARAPYAATATARGSHAAVAVVAMLRYVITFATASRHYAADTPLLPLLPPLAILMPL